MRVLSDGRPRANLVGVPLGLLLSGLVALAVVGAFVTVRSSDVGTRFTQLEALTEWVRSNPPEVVAARLKELDDALGQMLDQERDRELREMTS